MFSGKEQGLERESRGAQDSCRGQREPLISRFRDHLPPPLRETVFLNSPLRKPTLKIILYYLVYVAVSKRQNRSGGEQISGCQELEWGEDVNTKGKPERVFWG